MTATPARRKRSTQVHRVEVRSVSGHPDPVAAAVLDQARQTCGSEVRVDTAQVYLIEADVDDGALSQIADQLLADPVNQVSERGAAPPPSTGTIVEIHYKIGVMDPVAHSTRDAITQMLPGVANAVTVRTGRRYDLVGSGATRQAAFNLARTALANPVIHDVYDKPFWPKQFPQGTPHELRVREIPIRDLDESELNKLSRDRYLFLSLEEMRQIQAHYRRSEREPTDVEIETFAQTWSEHCVHKTFNSTIRYDETRETDESACPSIDDWVDRPGHELNEDGSLTIHNLFKSTIVAATKQLIDQRIAKMDEFCISVFADNAGIVGFDEEDGIAIKVETHNHPSAIEPYGGAATGIGGCIRDILGTGLGAQPIANTDTFAVAWNHDAAREVHPQNGADPDQTAPDDSACSLPKGIIAPKRILEQVVAGVRDYGNRMGIATVNGSVYFDDDYLGNPLVFVGCVGLIPRKFAFGEAEAADRIVVLGGRTGRDGIHGATFSSAELTDRHADEFSHAVQIGNPITQKKMLDVILKARDADGGPLYHAITDCGAGGFSSAVGEMGEKLGAQVELDRAPLKYQGLSYTEIWISEAQERMVLAVPPDAIGRLKQLCDAEDVEMCDLGSFGIDNDQAQPELRLTFENMQVGRIAMTMLHDGIPMPTRRAQWRVSTCRPTDQMATTQKAHLGQILLALLAHPNIASKHWIVRQYDHEVQGGSVVKPLVGPGQDGPSDAAVIRPRLNGRRGVAIGAGMQPGIGEKAAPRFACEGDSYWMALASIDEAVRNVVCVGADPARIALLDNFCWPSCDDPSHLGALVRALEACHDAALAYRAPFVSGKDSLNNQFTLEDGQVITIPPTLLITAVGMVCDVSRCVTMDAKSGGNDLVVVGKTGSSLGGSHYVRITGDRTCDWRIPRADLQANPKTSAAVGQLIEEGLVRTVHDCSDGGLLVAAAEMAFSGRLGLDLDLDGLLDRDDVDMIAACFAEMPGRFLLEVEPAKQERVMKTLDDQGVDHAVIGKFSDQNKRLTMAELDLPIEQLYAAWRRPLDW